MKPLWIAAALIGLGARLNVASADDAMTFSLEDVQTATARHLSAGEPEKDALDRALGELRWGMSKAELLQVLKARIRTELADQIRHEPDVIRQDALLADAKRRYADVKRNYVVFDGRKTGWDAAPLASEFRHGSDEAMLVVDSAAARDHYFFIAGKLWKWFRELRSDTGRGVDAGAAASAFVAELGDPRRQARQLDADLTVPALTWRNERTELSLFRRGADVCLVFEDRATLAGLAVLRRNAEAREKRANPTLDGVVMSADEREAWRRRQK